MCMMCMGTGVGAGIDICIGICDAGIVMACIVMACIAMACIGIGGGGIGGLGFFRDRHQPRQPRTRYQGPDTRLL